MIIVLIGFQVSTRIAKDSAEWDGSFTVACTSMWSNTLLLGTAHYSCLGLGPKGNRLGK